MSFDEIESLLGDIAPRRKLLLLDTCESGEMDETTRAELTAKIRDAGLAARTSPVFQQAHSGEPKRVFLYERDRYIYNDLARRTGSIIFSASHAGEMSFESPKIQNGFLRTRYSKGSVQARPTLTGMGRFPLMSSRLLFPSRWHS